MASNVRAAVSTPSAQVIGDAFAHQYYHILHQSPEIVRRFYNDNSKLGRPEGLGGMSLVAGVEAISQKIQSMGYANFTSDIKTVDAQESLNGGLVVLVTGLLTGNDDVKKNFTQSFFLGTQEKGYFILNDLFRYVEEGDGRNGSRQGVVNSSSTPAAGSMPSAQVVGNAFVHEYYHLLQQSPELVHKFYLGNSKLGRPEGQGGMCLVTGMNAINQKIRSMGYTNFRVAINTVNSQESLSGGVIVLVTGSLAGNNGVKRNFTQVFFLATQERSGYYVLNDIFRYIEDGDMRHGNQGVANRINASVASELGTTASAVRVTEQSVQAVTAESSSSNASGVASKQPCASIVKTMGIPDSVKVPTFTCPVCITPLVEASSTVCGHIFCRSCITASIQTQKKCPTCRRKLTMIDFHPVYLPPIDCEAV